MGESGSESSRERLGRGELQRKGDMCSHGPSVGSTLATLGILTGWMRPEEAAEGTG